MVTERLLVRDCSAFTDHEKVSRDESVLEYIHCLLDMAYSDLIRDVYLVDIDFYTVDVADRFERLIYDSGLLTVEGTKIERFCRCSFRFQFHAGTRGLFVSLI